jgi:hypothetical protein
MNPSLRRSCARWSARSAAQILANVGTQYSAINVKQTSPIAASLARSEWKAESHRRSLNGDEVSVAKAARSRIGLKFTERCVRGLRGHAARDADHAALTPGG